MQALMLAAGMGRRLGKYTNNHTKCMVPVCGVTLIERAISALKAAGIDKLIMVVGYQADSLVEFIAEHAQGMTVEYVYNYDYATTNNIYSLYLARDYLVQDDTLLVESDLVYEPEMIRRVVEYPASDVAALSSYRHWMHGTVTKLDADGNITQFIPGSDFRYSDTAEYYKTINIYKFSKEFSQCRYLPFLEAHIRAYGVNQYYEMVLKVLATVSNAQLKGCVVDDIPWYEIDDAQDLNIADTIFSEPTEKLRKMEYRFGGYWRFDNLKDFCYLVNPYFPPQEMLEQYRFFFPTLISQYPSGLNVQNLLAAKMFRLNEQYMLVGNGAAELINTLGHCMTGSVGYMEPVFHEYVRCFPACQMTPIQSIDRDFRFDLPALLHAAETLDAVVIVNPDNPSGAFLQKEDLFAVLDACKAHSTRCIVDESFVDFAETEQRFTLLSDEVLEAYPSLIVIKSISKSYGVPGIRLGILATADAELCKTVRAQMPIWNINSFAEFFLQNYELYASQYALACDRIAEQRASLAAALRDIPALTVYPSQANYIMCKLTGGMTSTELAQRLLSRYNLLIKDLSPKDGFDHGSYIRVAVKNELDNRLLLSALQDLLC